MKIFCRKVVINKPEVLKETGPLLLACNHPNSFLDGVIFDTLLERSIYTLARGDVFKKPIYIRLLTAVKLLPVYRISEGAENLGINYDTFATCRSIFNNGGIVLMFSEGKCINEWHLRPLKKGTARLSVAAWNENIPLRVLPVGINYSSFRRFGKNIFINFGEIIHQADIPEGTEGMKHQAFNTLLEGQLKNLVFEIRKDDPATQRKILEIKPSVLAKILFFLPAVIGYCLHWPLYAPVKRFTWKRTNHNDHYDAVLTAILLFAYPVYLLIISLIIFLVIKSWWAFLLMLIIPFTAWAYVQVKGQIDR